MKEAIGFAIVNNRHGTVQAVHLDEYDAINDTKPGVHLVRVRVVEIEPLPKRPKKNVVADGR